MNKITIYADGGCRGNQFDENIGGYGVYIVYNGQTKELKGAMRNTTNNIMELTSAIEGLKALKKRDTPVEVIMDSQYVVTGINEWIHGWIKKGWRTASKKPVENKALWQELYSLKNEFKDIVFTKCKGHADNEGNNKADELANQAMGELK